MRIGICDDDVQDLELIHTICKRTQEDLEEEWDILLFHNAEEVLECKEELQLLILDIEMPGLSGIELKQKLQREGVNTSIIYVTSHKELVKSAIGLSVYGFIEKEDVLLQLQQMLEDYINTIDPWLTLDNGVDSRDVIYIEAIDDYMKMHMQNGSDVLFRTTMKAFERLLQNYNYVRPEKSHLVNLMYVSKLENNVLYVGNKAFKITKDRRRPIKENYMKYRKKKARYC